MSLSNYQQEQIDADSNKINAVLDGKEILNIYSFLDIVGIFNRAKNKDYLEQLSVFLEEKQFNFDYSDFNRHFNNAFREESQYFTNNTITNNRNTIIHILQNYEIKLNNDDEQYNYFKKFLELLFDTSRSVEEREKIVGIMDNLLLPEDVVSNKYTKYKFIDENLDDIETKRKIIERKTNGFFPSDPKNNKNAAKKLQELKDSFIEQIINQKKGYIEGNAKKQWEKTIDGLFEIKDDELKDSDFIQNAQLKKMKIYVLQKALANISNENSYVEPHDLHRLEDYVNKGFIKYFAENCDVKTTDVKYDNQRLFTPEDIIKTLSIKNAISPVQQNLKTLFNNLQNYNNVFFVEIKEEKEEFDSKNNPKLQHNIWTTTSVDNNGNKNITLYFNQITKKQILQLLYANNVVATKLANQQGMSEIQECNEIKDFAKILNDIKKNSLKTESYKDAYLKYFLNVKNNLLGGLSDNRSLAIDEKSDSNFIVLNLLGYEISTDILLELLKHQALSNDMIGEMKVKINDIENLPSMMNEYYKFIKDQAVRKNNNNLTPILNLTVKSDQKFDSIKAKKIFNTLESYQYEASGICFKNLKIDNTDLFNVSQQLKNHNEYVLYGQNDIFDSEKTFQKKHYQKDNEVLSVLKYKKTSFDYTKPDGNIAINFESLNTDPNNKFLQSKIINKINNNAISNVDVAVETSTNTDTDVDLEILMSLKKKPLLLDDIRDNDIIKEDNVDAKMFALLKNDNPRFTRETKEILKKLKKVANTSWRNIYNIVTSKNDSMAGDDFYEDAKEKLSGLNYSFTPEAFVHLLYDYFKFGTTRWNSEFGDGSLSNYFYRNANDKNVPIVALKIDDTQEQTNEVNNMFTSLPSSTIESHKEISAIKRDQNLLQKFANMQQIFCMNPDIDKVFYKNISLSTLEHQEYIAKNADTIINFLKTKLQSSSFFNITSNICKQISTPKNLGAIRHNFALIDPVKLAQGLNKIFNFIEQLDKDGYIDKNTLCDEINKSIDNTNFHYIQKIYYFLLDRKIKVARNILMDQILNHNLQISFDINDDVEVYKYINKNSHLLKQTKYSEFSKNDFHAFFKSMEYDSLKKSLNDYFDAGLLSVHTEMVEYIYKLFEFSLNDNNISRIEINIDKIINATKKLIPNNTAETDEDLKVNATMISFLLLLNKKYTKLSNGELNDLQLDSSNKINIIKSRVNITNFIYKCVEEFNQNDLAMNQAKNAQQKLDYNSKKNAARLKLKYFLSFLITSFKEKKSKKISVQDINDIIDKLKTIKLENIHTLSLIHETYEKAGEKLEDFDYLKCLNESLNPSSDLSKMILNKNKNLLLQSMTFKDIFKLYDISNTFIDALSDQQNQITPEDIKNFINNNDKKIGDNSIKIDTPIQLNGNYLYYNQHLFVGAAGLMNDGVLSFKDLMNKDDFVQQSFFNIVKNKDQLFQQNMFQHNCELLAKLLFVNDYDGEYALSNENKDNEQNNENIKTLKVLICHIITNHTKGKKLDKNGQEYIKEFYNLKKNNPSYIPMVLKYIGLMMKEDIGNEKANYQFEDYVNFIKIINFLSQQKFYYNKNFAIQDVFLVFKNLHSNKTYLLDFLKNIDKPHKYLPIKFFSNTLLDISQKSTLLNRIINGKWNNYSFLILLNDLEEFYISHKKSHICLTKNTINNIIGSATSKLVNIQDDHSDFVKNFRQKIKIVLDKMEEISQQYQKAHKSGNDEVKTRYLNLSGKINYLINNFGIDIVCKIIKDINKDVTTNPDIIEILEYMCKHPESTYSNVKNFFTFKLQDYLNIGYTYNEMCKMIAQIKGAEDEKNHNLQVIEAQKQAIIDSFRLHDKSIDVDNVVENVGKTVSEIGSKFSELITSFHNEKYSKEKIIKQLTKKYKNNSILSPTSLSRNENAELLSLIVNNRISEFENKKEVNLYRVKEIKNMVNAVNTKVKILLRNPKLIEDELNETMSCISMLDEFDIPEKKLRQKIKHSFLLNFLTVFYVKSALEQSKPPRAEQIAATILEYYMTYNDNSRSICKLATGVGKTLTLLFNSFLAKFKNKTAITLTTNQLLVDEMMADAETMSCFQGNIYFINEKQELIDKKTNAVVPISDIKNTITNPSCAIFATYSNFDFWRKKMLLNHGKDGIDIVKHIAQHGQIGMDEVDSLIDTKTTNKLSVSTNTKEVNEKTQIVKHIKEKYQFIKESIERNNFDNFDDYILGIFFNTYHMYYDRNNIEHKKLYKQILKMLDAYIDAYNMQNGVEYTVETVNDSSIIYPIKQGVPDKSGSKFQQDVDLVLKLKLTDEGYYFKDLMQQSQVIEESNNFEIFNYASNVFGVSGTVSGIKDIWCKNGFSVNNIQQTNPKILNENYSAFTKTNANGDNVVLDFILFCNTLDINKINQSSNESNDDHTYNDIVNMFASNQQYSTLDYLDFLQISDNTINRKLLFVQQYIDDICYAIRDADGDINALHDLAQDINNIIMDVFKINANITAEDLDNLDNDDLDFLYNNLCHLLNEKTNNNFIQDLFNNYKLAENLIKKKLIDILKNTQDNNCYKLTILKDGERLQKLQSNLQRNIDRFNKSKYRDFIKVKKLISLDARTEVVNNNAFKDYIKNNKDCFVFALTDRARGFDFPKDCHLIATEILNKELVIQILGRTGRNGEVGYVTYAYTLTEQDIKDFPDETQNLINSIANNDEPSKQKDFIDKLCKAKTDREIQNFLIKQQFLSLQAEFGDKMSLFLNYLTEKLDKTKKDEVFEQCYSHIGQFQQTLTENFNIINSKKDKDLKNNVNKFLDTAKKSFDNLLQGLYTNYYVVPQLEQDEKLSFKEIMQRTNSTFQLIRTDEKEIHNEEEIQTQVSRDEFEDNLDIEKRREIVNTNKDKTLFFKNKSVYEIKKDDNKVKNDFTFAVLGSLFNYEYDVSNYNVINKESQNIEIEELKNKNPEDKVKEKNNNINKDKKRKKEKNQTVLSLCDDIIIATKQILKDEDSELLVDDVNIVFINEGADDTEEKKKLIDRKLSSLYGDILKIKKIDAENIEIVIDDGSSTNKTNKYNIDDIIKNNDFLKSLSPQPDKNALMAMITNIIIQEYSENNSLILPEQIGNKIHALFVDKIKKLKSVKEDKKDNFSQFFIQDEIQKIKNSLVKNGLEIGVNEKQIRLQQKNNRHNDNDLKTIDILANEPDYDYIYKQYKVLLDKELEDFNIILSDDEINKIKDDKENLSTIINKQIEKKIFKTKTIMNYIENQKYLSANNKNNLLDKCRQFLNPANLVKHACRLMKIAGSISFNEEFQRAGKENIKLDNAELFKSTRYNNYEGDSWKEGIKVDNLYKIDNKINAFKTYLNAKTTTSSTVSTCINNKNEYDLKQAMIDGHNNIQNNINLIEQNVEEIKQYKNYFDKIENNSVLFTSFENNEAIALIEKYQNNMKFYNENLLKIENNQNKILSEKQCNDLKEKMFNVNIDNFVSGLFNEQNLSKLFSEFAINNSNEDNINNDTLFSAGFNDFTIKEKELFERIKNTYYNIFGDFSKLTGEIESNHEKTEEEINDYKQSVRLFQEKVKNILISQSQNLSKTSDAKKVHNYLPYNIYNYFSKILKCLNTNYQENKQKQEKLINSIKDKITHVISNFNGIKGLHENIKNRINQYYNIIGVNVNKDKCLTKEGIIQAVQQFKNIDISVLEKINSLLSNDVINDYNDTKKKIKKIIDDKNSIPEAVKYLLVVITFGLILLTDKGKEMFKNPQKANKEFIDPDIYNKDYSNINNKIIKEYNKGIQPGR